MTTFNGMRFLAKQVESIQAQLGPDDELVVGDDQSTDNTVAYLRGLNDPRIKVHVNEQRLRHVRNFEACIAHATGELLVMSDQDDIWCPGKIDRTREIFETYPDVTLFHHALELVDVEDRPLGRRYETKGVGLQNGSAFLLRQFIRGEIFGSASALRASACRFLMPFPEAVYAHDHWFAIANAVCGKVYLSNEPLLLYRQHESNLTPKAPAPIWKRVEWRWKMMNQAFAAAQRGRHLAV